MSPMWEWPPLTSPVREGSLMRSGKVEVGGGICFWPQNHAEGHDPTVPWASLPHVDHKVCHNLSFFKLRLFLCVRACAGVPQGMCEANRHFALVLSYCVGPRERTQVVRLSRLTSKPLY